TLEPDSGASLSIQDVDNGDPLPQNLIFVIQQPSEGVDGRVLAAFKPAAVSLANYSNVGWHDASVSLARRQALRKVFEVSGAQGRGGSCVESSATGLPESSCIAGLFRNQYVPVANDLSGSGSVSDDSW